MKRVIYISRLVKSLSDEEIEDIGRVSSRNNRRVNITGVLVYVEKLFFQIIEGDNKDIDHLFGKIAKDPRHQDILRLKTEYEVDL